jgi:glycosyltransferase involved in cell wall biosynthesis
VISVEQHLSKKYLVGHRAECDGGHLVLSETIIRHVRNVGRKSLDMARGRQIIQGDEVEEFWAFAGVARDTITRPRRLAGICMSLIGRVKQSYKIRKLILLLRARAFRALPRPRSLATKRTVVVFDPALHGYNGHHAEFARLLREGLRPSSEVRFYANYSAETKLLWELRADPVCPESIYLPSGESEFGTTCRHHSDLLLDSLNCIRRSQLDPENILVMHTLTVYQLPGLARWYAKLRAGSRPKVFLQFQFPLEFGVSAADWSEVTVEARTACESLARNGVVRFASNSRALADSIERQIRQTCVLMPLPVRWPAEPTATAPRQDGPVFGFFGGLRTEKGAALLAEAIPVFVSRFPDTRFIVHAPDSESDPAAVRALRSVPRVELITDNFRRKDDYFAAFRRAGCILLPYDPMVYRLRTSGIFVEATGLGQLVVVTGNTWMQSELGSDPANAVILPGFTSQALLNGIEQAREILIKRGFTALPNAGVVEANSPVKFCDALLRLMDA